MTLISSSLKPLAMRSMIVVGSFPERNPCIAAVISVAVRPMSLGTGVSTAWPAGWQPVQEAAPGGPSGEAATAIWAVAQRIIPARIVRAVT